MEIRRTANAGVLLKLDGVSILLDGVCREVKPYPATPDRERASLSASFPDMIAFTHAHSDHYDPDFAAEYQKQTGGVILGPGDLPGCHASKEPARLGGVTVTPVSSRHIGAAGKTTSHLSFILEGSRCVWFVGDASPLQWKNRTDLPMPDVVIGPYAYASTPAALEIVKSLGAKTLVLLHLPDRADDDVGLWEMVDAALKQNRDLRVYIPALSQIVKLPACP